MRALLLAILPAALLTTVACSAPTDPSTSDPATPSAEQALSQDPCVAAARAAAEEEYGNSPDGTSVKALVKGKRYRVTVGINNPEDGPADYYVDFPSGCSSKPKVSDVPSLPHPLRDATQRVYSGILRDHDKALPSGFEVSQSSLPAAARTQLRTWKSNGPSVCSAVGAYSIKVSGEDTFAVSCDVPADSIRTHIAIYDANGGSIDELAIYHSSEVGQDGLSWQNETFLQED
jgi:hypothetical protein